MARLPVKGAGDSHVQENPKVTSKFDRMGGKPRVPGSVERPGGVATPGGGGNSGKPQGHVGGFTENGHVVPRETTPAAGGHVVRHFAPHELGTAMSEGRTQGHTNNRHETDRITHGSGPHHDSGMLRGEPETVRARDSDRQGPAGRDAKPADAHLGTSGARR